MGKKTKASIKTIERVINDMSKFSGSELALIDKAVRNKDLNTLRIVMNKPNLNTFGVGRYASQYLNYITEKNTKAERIFEKKFGIKFTSNPSEFLDKVYYIANPNKRAQQQQTHTPPTKPPKQPIPPKPLIDNIGSILKKFLNLNGFNFWDKGYYYQTTSENHQPTPQDIRQILTQLNFSTPQLNRISDYISKIRLFLVLTTSTGTDIFVSSKLCSIWNFRTDFDIFLMKYINKKTLTEIKEVIVNEIPMVPQDYYYEQDYVPNELDEYIGGIKQKETITHKITGLKTIFINYYTKGGKP